STMSIHQFNPLSIQQPSQDSTLLYIQELIYYAESRFWSIVNEMSKAKIDQQSWVQKLLHWELLFVLSYIGISTTLGKAIEIPIIMRSLANSMGLLHEDALPLIMDPSFLATLDMGAHEKESKSKIVSEYEHQWWSSQKPRDLGTVKILNKSTVQECLNHYREQCSSPIETANVGDNAGVQVNARSRSSAGAGDNYACPRCTQYRKVLSDVLQDVITFRNLSSVMATSSETQWKLGLRRASTFHLLHEAAVLKETAGCSAPASATTVQNIGNVTRTASSELTQLQSLPVIRFNLSLVLSYKWTWGETLTKAEVLALH
ncbi:hypothetical protein BYT27DRAFT_7093990, partial [Phlegmacium glaucopus]